jgi:gluconokinase
MPEPVEPTTTIVVMGVSGCGKSTVAAELVTRTGWAFAEGDTFHPAANVAKMSAGHPLTDEDRWPWLHTLADWIGEHERAGQSVVVTCSALRRAYRDVLREGHPSVRFAHITVPEQVLADRLAHRTGHYMPASLLASQLETLEPLQADEPGVTVTSETNPGAVAEHILREVADYDARSEAAGG